MKKIDTFIMIILMCVAFSAGILLILCVYPLGEDAVLITTLICSTLSIVVTLVCLIISSFKKMTVNCNLELTNEQYISNKNTQNNIESEAVYIKTVLDLINDEIKDIKDSFYEDMYPELRKIDNISKQTEEIHKEIMYKAWLRGDYPLRK